MWPLFYLLFDKCFVFSVSALLQSSKWGQFKAYHCPRAINHKHSTAKQLKEEGFSLYVCFLISALRVALEDLIIAHASFT